jgi:hypothetical protein
VRRGGGQQLGGAAGAEEGVDLAERPWIVSVGVLASHAFSAAQTRSTGLSCGL